MLSLAAPTSPGWLDRARGDVETLLLDHAHCEKKAASTALGLLYAHPDEDALVRALPALAREELAHFELVLGLLDERGIRFRRVAPSAYAGRLREAVRASGRGRLVDVLLCCALVEARSCERMRVLAEGLATEDPRLAAFYGSLLASEARHHRAYVDLAEAVASRPEVGVRLAQLAGHEVAVLSSAAPGPRLHDA